MRTTAAALALLIPGVSLADDLKAPAAFAKHPDVPALITQLSDRDYATREGAMKRLEEIGQPALAPLETATRSDVAEVAERATQLLVRISRRLDAEKALAPTHVELPADEQTLQAVFNSIEKQSRYKLRVNGDQAILAQKVKLAAGKRSFWEAVQQVCDTTGLEVESVGNPWQPSITHPIVTDTGRSFVNDRDILNAHARITQYQVDLAKYQELLAEYSGRLKAATGDDVKKIEELIAKEKQKAERVEKLISEMETRYGFKSGGLPLLGTVVLRTRTKADPNTACLSGAVRVEATPVPADGLKRYAPTHLPLALTVYPEPRLNWQGVTDAVVVESVGPDGVPLTPSYFIPKTYDNLANDELQFRRARLRLRDGEQLQIYPPNVGFAALNAPTSGKGVTLKSVRGLIRGSVWTSPGELLAAADLDTTAETTVLGPDGIALSVKVKEPDAALRGTQPPIRCVIELKLQHDPTTCRPLNGKAATTAATDPVWLNNGPGGRVVPLRANPPAPRPNIDMYGLMFTDAEGKPFDVTQHTAVTGYQTYHDGRYRTVTSFTYVARGAANTGPPLAKVSFHGSRLQEVTVPFKLTDVPLTPGTGDGKPLPEDYREWKR